MTWLVACECSGRVRDAMLALGVDAVSCDLEASETDGPHIIGDVSDLLRRRWAGVVAHPPCDYLANSGARWRVERDEVAEVARAAAFFRLCLSANSPRVAVENPIMAHAVARVGRRPDFTVQPWQFGDNFKKRTCFWTRGLPRLVPTSDLDGSTAVAAVHLEPPGPDRKRIRSRTYPGMAAAIAAQWGAA
jgi:hypothetical protein